MIVFLAPSAEDVLRRTQVTRPAKGWSTEIGAETASWLFF